MRNLTGDFIEHTNSDMFESGAEALVNPVNTEGIMGKGLALEFRRRYPTAAGQYVRACEERRFGIGDVLVTPPDVRAPYILHFPTKTTWRKPSRLPYIVSGLSALRQALIDNLISSVAVPALGCGEGGLKWEDVRPLLFEWLPIPNVVIHIYPPGRR